MDKIETVESLKTLLQTIEAMDTAAQKKDSARKEKVNLKFNYPSKLDAFDRSHKSAFIISRIGKPPVKPHGIIKLAVPVYFAKKRQYEKDSVAYRKAFMDAEKSYEEFYYIQREDLSKQDVVEKEEKIKAKEVELSEVENAYAEAKQAVEQNDLLSEKLKTKDTVKALIGYFDDHRVDTLKEAINLWFDEKRKDEEEARAEAHRQEMKALEEERVRAAKAAEDYARQQYEEASNAAMYAQEAAEKAQEAVDIAQRVENNQSYYN
jgi:hypothetical protein